MNPEVFYLHLKGEQRGPYTVPQIDHLLNSGIIQEETLFWREGLEDWQPVTTLVTRRKEGRKWVKSSVAGAVLLVLLVLALIVRLFASTIHLGWQETNQHEFTAEAAYWRARDFVRHRSVPKGSLVEFRSFGDARVALAPSSATVLLRGSLSDSHGVAREVGWNVTLVYDPGSKEWSGASIEESAQSP